MLYNSALYPEPDVFKPERLLNADGSLQDDPVLTSAFGFGKWICPGRHFVNAMLFIMVASLFSVFNIERGESGWGELSN
jgi:cytochrome P450